MFVNRDIGQEAMQFWLFSDLELAEAYKEFIECRARFDYHLIQNELESRGLSLDDLEEILSNRNV